MTAGAGFVTEEMNHMTSTGTNPPAGIGNIDQTKPKTKMKMNFNKEALIYMLVQGIGAIIILWLCLHLVGCKTTCIPERIEVHDTVIHTDSFYVDRVRDSIVYRDRKDSTYIYEKDSTSERQRGDTIYLTRWKVKYMYVYRERTDSVATAEKIDSTAVSNHQQTSTEQQVIVKTERYIPGFYRFTMWLFWIVVVLLVLWLVWWLADYIPVLKPYKQAIKTFLKIVH